MKRITTELFKQRLAVANPSLILEGEYINKRTKVLVKDNNGNCFYKYPQSLLAGSNANMQTSINKTDFFIKKANIIHNNKYNYSKTIYTNNTTKVYITCLTHGDFLQLPGNHLKGSECPYCNFKFSSKTFLEKLNTIFPDLTILSKYDNSKKQIIVKDSFNIKYKVYPLSLLRGSYPCISSALDKKEAFSIKANLIHNYKYNYDNVNYKNNHTKVSITCKEHGTFLQTPHAHLSGQNCMFCNEINRLNFTKTKWINHCNNNNLIPLLYIIKCFDKKESFVKIGITSRSIDKRFKYTLPYKYKIIQQFQGSPKFIWEEEKRLHKLLKKFKYTPKKNFGGKTECFSLSALQNLDI